MIIFHNQIFIKLWKVPFLNIYINYYIVMSLVHLISLMFPQKRIDIFGESSLLLSSLPYYTIVIIMLLATKYIWDNSWLIIFISYVLLPYLDQVFSLDQRNPTQKQRKQLQRQDHYFKIALYVTVALDWYITWRFLNFCYSFQLSWGNSLNFIGIIVFYHSLQSAQYAVSHEIYHKQGNFNKYLGAIHIIKNLYPQFAYQHLHGHHKYVATPEDPVTALKGQSYYQFFRKSFFGSCKNTYIFERDQNKPFYLNYGVLSVISSLLILFFIFKFYNIQTMICFVIPSLGAIFFAEGINYIEHYGLLRKKLSNGQYQKVNIKHSWNTPHRFTNYIFFKIQRHSDHHQNSLKPYQTLLSLDQSPHLPHGYTLMVLMSFFPSLWFRIMNALVEQYQKTGKGDINGERNKQYVEMANQFIIKVWIIVSSIFLTSLIIKWHQIQ